MLNISKNQTEKFKEIKKKFLSNTKIPRENRWKKMSNNDIWLDLVTQVIVVGNSAPFYRFYEDEKLQGEISYEKLIRINSEGELKKKINKVLRAVGTRYASSNYSKCKKTAALVHNLMVLKKYKEGPKGLIEELSCKNEDITKIKYFMNNFKYIGSKSARDYLMGLGLVKNTVALDVRIQNIFNKIGIKLPKGFENNPKIYDEIEKDILTKICQPLGLDGIQFDRMLYQNYDEIMDL